MSLFEKNLALLRERYPACADWLEKAPDDPRVECIDIKPGTKDLRVTGKNKQKFLFYNTDDPLTHEKELIRESKFETNCVTFLVGLGLGYSLLAILERMEKKHTLVVIECNATIMREALHTLDLSLITKEGSRIIFCPPQLGVVEQLAIRLFTGEIGFDAPEDIRILLHPSSSNISPEYDDHFKLLEKLFYYCMVNLKTRTFCGKIFAENEIQNLPQIVSSPGLTTLFDRLPKIPAIVVSAGPSLYKNVHLLKKIERKAFIIATAPVVRVLLAHDIRPHLVGSMDYSPENYQPFEGICDAEGIPLIYLTRLYPRVVVDYQGDLIVVPQLGGIINWLGNFWGDKPVLPSCGNVGLFCLHIAAAMGGDPILLVGQDLSFTGNSSHTEGIVGRLQLDTNKEKYLWVEGNLGDKVPVNSAFLAYIKQFKEAIGSMKNQCVNATEGGAFIEGAAVMPLAEAIDKYCHEEYDIPSLIQGALQSASPDSVDYPGLIREIESKVKTFRHLKSLCQKGLKNNRKVEKKIRKSEYQNDEELNDLLRENHRISTELQEFNNSFALFHIYMAAEIYQINRRDYEEDSEQAQDLESLTKGIKRNRYVLRASEKALVEFARQFQKSVSLIKEFYKGQKEVLKTPHDSQKQFQWGKILMKLGYGKKAREAFLRAMELGGKDADLLFGLAGSYWGSSHLKEAREILGQIRDQYPQQRDRVQEELERIRARVEKWGKKAQGFWAQGDWVNTLLYCGKGLDGPVEGLEMEDLFHKAMKAREMSILTADTDRKDWTGRWKAHEEYKDLFAQARGMFDKGHFPEAVRTLENILRLPFIDPLEAQVLLACVYSELGEIKKTEELLKQAIAKSPSTGLFHINLGRAFLRNGHILEGLQELEKAIQKENRFYEHHMEIGNIYFQKRNYEKALSHFDQYLTHNQGSYEALAKAGNCNLARGLIEGAEVYYRKALNLKPDYPAAQLGISTIDRIKQNGMKNC